MPNRILIFFAALMAVIGLAAPAASASSSVGTGCSPCHLMTNVNTSVGITYPGIGSQVTVTTSPGSSTVEWVNEAYGIVVIHNNNGYCLKMRDAANGHAITEDFGCDTNDLAELFVMVQFSNGTYGFASEDYSGYYLGVSCGAHNGSPLWGFQFVSGTCIGWQKHSA